jgi:hypothetical protein
MTRTKTHRTELGAHVRNSVQRARGPAGWYVPVSWATCNAAITTFLHEQVPRF